MIKRGRSNAAGVAEIAQAFEELKLEVSGASNKIQFSSGLDLYLKQASRDI